MKTILLFLLLFPGLLFAQRTIKDPRFQDLQLTGGTPAGIALLETDPTVPAGTSMTYVTGLITVAAGVPTGATDTFPPFYYDSAGGTFWAYDGTTWQATAAGGGGGLVNWGENGTTFRPNVAGYSLGLTGNEVGPILTNGRVSQTGLGGSTIFGELAGINDDLTTNMNTAFGYNTLNATTTGESNVAVGFGALQLNTVGNWNTAVGDSALDANTTGEDNTAVGFISLSANTSGMNNTAVGLGALRSNTIGFANTAVGKYTLENNTTGDENVAMGFQALRQNTIGVSNVAIGRQAMLTNTTGEHNVAIGNQAMFKSSGGILNVGIGYQSMWENTTGGWNTAVGTESLTKNTTGVRNAAFGYRSLEQNTTGINNIAIGYNSLDENRTGDGNIAIGWLAGHWGDYQKSVTLNDSSSNSIFIGNDTTSGNTIGNPSPANQIVIGSGATGWGENKAVWGGPAITDNIFHGSIILHEKAAASTIIDQGGLAPQQGLGDIWVKNDTPNTLWFTDDAGTDFQLNGGGGGGDALTTNPLSQFAATTSAQLAGVLSDETGTNLAVYNTSPTLVTPILGTPTSVTLTNATGLPLTTGITGTLPVANGGTGRTTSTTAYGLLAAGTTATGAHQTLAAGLTTQLLVGGGASALPSWTTATGTGAPVRATSPALVTPALGTPASGVMTNVTGLPTTGLVDDAVTLAKLAAGTAGNLITYDAAGNPAAVATGTTGQALLSNGAGAAPTFQTLPGGGDALTTNPLSQFAATTSAQLAGVMSDETGTNLAVFNTNPVLVTPDLGTPSALTLTNATGLTTTGLVDGAVTLLKMGGGVAGNLITYNSFGVAMAVATGTSGQVLTSNGAGTAPTFQAAAGGGDALTSNPLSQFAATTSAQLAGVLSDEDGTGNFLTTNGSAADLTSFPTLNQSTTGNADTATLATTATTANAGDSATAFFPAGTIEHERGGLEADVSAFGGLVSISGGATVEVNTLSGLNTAITDATLIDQTDFDNHVNNLNNPHLVDAVQAGAVPWHDGVVDPVPTDDLNLFTEGTIKRNNQGTSAVDDSLWILLDDSVGAADWRNLFYSNATGGLDVASLDVSGTLNAGSLEFEGATADAFETTVAVTDPTADNTITLPDASGTVALTSDPQTDTWIIAASDETTALTTGAAKVTFLAPYAATITAIEASVTTAPTDASLIVDVNEAGTTLMTTNKCVIETAETSTLTATTPPGETDTAIAQWAVITIDIDQIGSTIAGAGLKVYLTHTH